MQMVADAGHEIGLHGYSHENPVAMTPEQEEAVLNKCIALIERFAGQRPTGYVAPWWELSAATVALLLKNGITYDHSRMDNDFHPFYARVGDTWTKIDYSQSAETWMKPLVRGQETDLVEIGANWYVDDLPPMMFIKKAPNSHGFVNPRHPGEIWRDQFDWVYREYDYAVFPITIHPDVSGGPRCCSCWSASSTTSPGTRGCAGRRPRIAADFRERYPAPALARPESVIAQGERPGRRLMP